MIEPETIIGIGFIVAMIAGAIWIFPVPTISRTTNTKVAKAMLYFAIFAIIIGAFGIAGLGDWGATILYDFLQ